MGRPVVGGFILLLWVVGAASSCGGESISSREGSGESGGESGSSAGVGATGGNPSGGGGTGGSTSGGSENGGSGGTAGSPTGGASGTSGNAGSGAATGGDAGTTGGGGMTGGAAGAGGEPGFCSLPPETGNCLASFQRFFFDPPTGVCKPFVYGGCGGNANNFQSVEECYAACGGQGEIDPAACRYPTDCTLVPAGCCLCDLSHIGAVVAVNATQASKLSEAMGCHLVDCAACEPTASPWLGATCRAGRCVAFDARATELTDCSVREDCRLRAGLECCEDCNASRQSFIALNTQADVRSWLCGNSPVGCDACVPLPPPNLSVVCYDNGTCGVIDAELPQ